MSVVTSLAQNIETLIVARFVQGLAGTCGPVLARAMARDTTEGVALTKLTALLVTTLAVATLITPLIGSMLLDFWGWRAPFVFNIIAGVGALLMVSGFLYETWEVKVRPSLYKQFTGSLKAFVLSRQSIWGASLVGLTFFGYMAIVADLASVVVEVYDYSASSVGYLFGAAVIFYVVSAQLGRYILTWFSSYSQIHLGILLYAVSVIWCLIILQMETVGFWLVWGATLPFLLGMGLVFSNATATALAPLPKIAGFAASILGTVQMGLAALGATLTATFYDHSADSMLLIIGIGSAMACVVFTFRRSFSVVID